ESIILQITLPILAIVIAPERVSTTRQPGSLTMAVVTSRASPRLRPLKAVCDIPRSREANELTSSRSRLSSGTRPSCRPSWHSRVLPMPTPPGSYHRRPGRPLQWPVRIDDLRRRLDALYL